jgi:hypothetical protein
MKTRFFLEAVIGITLIITLCATAPIFLLHQAYALGESFPKNLVKKYQ